MVNAAPPTSQSNMLIVLVENVRVTVGNDTHHETSVARKSSQHIHRET